MLVMLGDSANDPIQMFTQTSGGFAEGANTTTGYVASKWVSACGVSPTVDSRTAYINGGNSGSGSTSITPRTLTGASIGRLWRPAYDPWYMDGNIAEVAIWSAALNNDEIAALAKGFKPTRIRPQSLVFYAPLLRNLQDIKGGRSLTNSNTCTVANHPRVY